MDRRVHQNLERTPHPQPQEGWTPIQQRDVVLIQSDERNRGKWNIGIVVKLIKGKDGIVKAARLRAGKSFLERAIQHLCPMELPCDYYKQPEIPVLNPQARMFTPRTAAVAAAGRIKDIVEQEEEIV